nr:class I SAM-dependent methyltransferase [Prolixibacteraceae bacterium]
ELTRRGYTVSAFDLDPSMIDRAVTKAGSLPVDFRVLDMLALDPEYPEDHFDGVTCFGNTLVHLPGTEAIASFFRSVYRVLKPGGKFLFQILNYDLIGAKRITSLPLIENKTIRFVREYEHLPGGSLLFRTRLFIKAEAVELMQNIELYPLRKGELSSLLEGAGFSSCSFSRSFEREGFSSESLPLIGSVVK